MAKLISQHNNSGSFSIDINLDELDSLINNTKPIVTSLEDSPPIDYGDKDKALNIVNEGYKRLPGAYNSVFLDPLKSLLETQDYQAILQSLDGNGSGPWHDWIASIEQRVTDYQSQETHAFEEVLADLYDGFLSREEGKRIKPPDYETVSPLAKWGSPEGGPYTWPSDAGKSLGIKMSTVNLPPAYSKNISLWSSIGHETGGHDVTHAYNGMLDELGSLVSTKLLERQSDPVLRGTANVNGRQEPLVTFAASYWKSKIDETSADVCGLLNIGPAAGISIAVLLISVRGGKLITVDTSDDVHHIDALRVYLAADVIRNIRELDVNVANKWADTFENIADKYIQDKNGFYLVSQTQDRQQHIDVSMPFKQMRETVKTVAEAIAFSPLVTLGGHALSEVNTWANTDEVLATRISNSLVDSTEPSLDPGPDGQKIYAAHVLSGATIALARGADISKTTDFAIKSLNKLYDQNPVWHGIPLMLRSQVNRHEIAPSFGVEFLENLTVRADRKVTASKRSTGKKRKTTRKRRSV
jgi:hypothetical protein